MCMQVATKPPVKCSVSKWVFSHCLPDVPSKKKRILKNFISSVGLVLKVALTDQAGVKVYFILIKERNHYIRLMQSPEELKQSIKPC